MIFYYSKTDDNKTPYPEGLHSETKLHYLLNTPYSPRPICINKTSCKLEEKEENGRTMIFIHYPIEILSIYLSRARYDEIVNTLK